MTHLSYPDAFVPAASLELVAVLWPVLWCTQNNPSWPFNKKKLMIQNIVRTLSKTASP